MKIHQPSLELVGSSLQLGKGGIKLVSAGGVAEVRLPSGVLAPLSVGEPSASSHVSTKNYVDSLVPEVYNAAGTKLAKAKRILVQTTTNSSGVWSVNVPNVGQTQVLYVNATAISGSSATLPGVAIAHIKQYSTSAVSGFSTIGNTIVTILLGGAATLVAAPTGTQIFVELLVQ